MDSAGLRVLVTGGARRIGRAICLELGRRGARVAVHYRASAEEAEEVAAAHPGSFALAADLGRAEECDALAAAAAERLGGLDLLVNNAAIYERTPLARIDEAAWDRHLDSNLKGPFFLARAAAREMQQGDGGLIVNLTDWGIDRPHPDFLPYYAAKAGLAALTAGLARALAPKVRVNAIAPGPVLAPEGAKPAYEAEIARLTPLGRFGGADAVVSALTFLIGNDFVTGETITVDGGRSLR